MKKWFKDIYKKASLFGKFVLFGIPLFIIVSFTIDFGLTGTILGFIIAIISHITFCFQLKSIIK
jgi:hypothetical protein